MPGLSSRGANLDSRWNRCPARERQHRREVQLHLAHVPHARRDLHAHQLVLVSAALIWGLQAVLVAACTALLFVRPVAVSMTRSQPGNVDVWKYAVWLGLLAASLPTYTKVSLRFAQLERAECAKKE